MIYALGLLLIAVSWLLPGHYLPWTSFEQDALCACGACAVAMSAIASPRRWLPRVPRPALVAGTLALVPLAQWGVGQITFHSDAVLSCAYLMAFAFSVIAAQQLATATPDRFFLSLQTAIVLAALLSVGFGLLQWLQLGPFGFLEPTSPTERISANLRQPNNLATLLGMGIVGVLWMYETRRLHGFVASTAIGILGFGLVMSQSRTGWLMVAALAAVWVGYRSRLALRAHVAAAYVAMSAFFLLVVFWEPLNHWLHQSSPLSLADRLQPGRRGVIWETMWDAALRAPWFGYGWLQTSNAQLDVTLDHPAINYWLSSSHNLVLDLLVWNGLPIGATVAAASVWWFVARFREVRDIGSAAPLLSLGILGIHSMLELPLLYAYFLVPAGLLVGIVESQSPSASRAWTLGVPKAAYFAAFLILSGLLGLVVSEYPKVEEATRRAGLRDVGVIQASAPPETPDVLLLDGPREFIRMWLTDAQPGMGSSQLEWMRGVAERYPAPMLLFKYAQAAGLNSDPSEAHRALALLCHVSSESSCADADARWRRLALSQPALAGIRMPDAQRAVH